MSLVAVGPVSLLALNLAYKLLRDPTTVDIENAIRILRDNTPASEAETVDVDLFVRRRWVIALEQLLTQTPQQRCKKLAEVRLAIEAKVTAHRKPM